MQLSHRFDLWRQVISAVVTLGLAGFGFLAVDALAGKTTITDIVVGYFTAEEGGSIWPWVMTVVFGGWAALEHRERKRKTEELHKQNLELELSKDANRTSSGLLETGETHPEDKEL